MRSFILALYVLISSFPLFSTPGGSYIYDELGYALPSPSPYIPESVIEFTYLPCGELDKPQSLSIDDEGTLYITDTGNSRVIMMAGSGDYLGVLEDETLGNPSNVFVSGDGGDIYVTDPKKKHISVFDRSTGFKRIYTQPDPETVPDSFIFDPAKVIVDRRGWLYVVGTGTSLGIIQLDAEGLFRGYFGANQAPQNLLRRLSRLIISEEQKRRVVMQTLLPTTNFAIDNQGFIYTVTEAIDNDQIRKLNPLGVNVYPAGSYGEQIPVSATISHAPQLSTVDVNENGVITVLDTRSGKLFQYDQEGELLFIFGGLGEILGTFGIPKDAVVDNVTGKLYVLDAELGGRIFVFYPTDFALMVQEASLLHFDGRYMDALELWLRILKLNANYPQAHKGVAKALLKLGRGSRNLDFLDRSMQHYYLAQDRAGYSSAFVLHRKIYMRNYLGLWLFIIIVSVVGIWAIFRFLKPFMGKHVRAFMNRKGWQLPAGFGKSLRELKAAFSVIIHPYNVMMDIKYSYTRLSAYVATGVVGLFLLARILVLFGTSFHFSSWDPERLKLSSEMVRFFLPWITWCSANWLLTLILAGEGKFSQIYVFSAYSLIPIIIGAPIMTGLSHLLSLDETVIYAGVQTFFYAWSGILLFSGVKIVHDFSLKKTLGICFLTVISIVILWGVLVLVYGFVGSIFAFLFNVIQEAATYGT